MEDILSLIPQRPPFVMVDALVNADDTSATTRYRVNAADIFVENGFLTEPALIENIAQTAAARMGHLCRLRNEAVPVGFIGAVQQFELAELPAVGDELETTIEIKNQVFDVTIISGAVYCNGKMLAKCDMKIFIKPDNQIKTN